MKKQLLFLALILPIGLLHAGNGSWTGASDTNWNTPGNWLGSIPNSAGDIATLANAGSNPTNARSVVVNVGETIGTLIIDNSGAYTVSGGSTLTFNNGAVASVININMSNGAAAHALNCPIALGAVGLTVNQNMSGTAFTMGTGGISGNAGIPLTMNGPGVLVLQGTNTGLQGGVTLTAGTLQVATDTTNTLGDPATTCTITGGTLQAGTASFTSARTFTITGSPMFDSQGFTGVTFPTISGQITGAGSFTKIGTGTFALTSGSSNYSGGTTVSNGTLQINADAALGAASTLTIATATLQAAVPSTITIAIHPISLTGTSTIDAQSTTMTISSIISNSGSLTVLGAGGGTLVLSGANTYMGGTTVTSGTLSVSNDGNLGNTAGSLSIGTASFLINAAGFNSARALSLTGSASTINSGGQTATFSGAISGSGTTTINGGGTIILSGNSNGYTGNTTINGNTILQGTTNSLQTSGTLTVTAGSTIDINQTFNGSYSGVLSGAGALQINNASGTGAVTLTGNSGSSFTGATSLVAGSLFVDGSLAGSTVTVSSGATLGGTGTVGATTINNGGTLAPGDGSSAGTLKINGTLTLNATSDTLIGITPTSSDAIQVTGTANLNGTLTITPSAAGFYPISTCYPILTATNPLVGTFNSPPQSTNSNFVPTLSYSTNTVTLCVHVLNPFFDFPFQNRNERSVGNNIGALNTAGELPAGLAALLNLFVGQSFDSINAALDQMHPAPYSAFIELQEEIGAKIISLFHRKPYLPFVYLDSTRIWLTPFGDSLTEKNHGEEFGFTANSGGLAIGFDGDIVPDWVLGFGAAWNNSHLEWKDHHGHGEVNGIYGAIYTDYQIQSFYLGASIYGGVDFYDTERHLRIFSLNEEAKANYTGFDVVGQLATAYYFGSPTAFLYPYANFDYLYCHIPSITEHGAGALDLDVRSQSASTFRTEMGLAFELIDLNYDETMGLTPLFSIGWVNMCPIQRDNFHSNFISAPIPFTTYGWDQTWNLFSLDFGLGYFYKSFSIDLKYNVEMSADKETLLYNHYGNICFEWEW